MQVTFRKHQDTVNQVPRLAPLLQPPLDVDGALDLNGFRLQHRRF